MKKFTKILIALGAAGIAKYIYDHIDIVTNEELEERIKKEAEVLRKEEEIDQNEIKYVYDKKFTDNIGKYVAKHIGENKIPVEMTQDLNNFVCDHVYYDNPYNISKIYLDKNGCPQVFEFENKEDMDKALFAIKGYFILDGFLSLENIFKIFGLIIDDYDKFRLSLVRLDPEDFVRINSENAIPKTINFGKFEK